MTISPDEPVDEEYEDDLPSEASTSDEDTIEFDPFEDEPEEDRKLS
jgi:hypothetical protein